MRPGSWTAAVLGALLGCSAETTPTGDAAAHDAADVATNDLGGMDDGGMDAGMDGGVPRCVPGMSVACACVGGVSGAQVCDAAGVYEACQCGDGGTAPADAPVVYVPIGGPRLILPRSVSRSMTQRPTFRWVPPEGVTRARVTVARNRALTMGVRSGEAEGTSWRPTEPLAFGVWFWRVEGLGGDGGVVWTSPTWEFRAPRRDSAVDSSWGKFRDFNGDGYDDLVVQRFQDTDIYHGSPSGIAATPTVALTAPPVAAPDRSHWIRGSMAWGDLNGDGLTDLAYTLAEFAFTGPNLDPYRVRLAVHWGAPAGLAAFPDLLLDEYGVSTGMTYAAITVGDSDGDGFDDLLVNVSHYDPNTRVLTLRAFVLRGSSDGRSLTRHGESSLSGIDEGMFRGAWLIDDLDLDGRPDLQVSRGSDLTQNELFLRGYDPPRPVTIPTRSTIRYIGLPPLGVVGDMNGDNHLECIQTSRDRLMISRTDGLPDGPLALWTTLSAPETPSSVTPDRGFGSRYDLGDTNGDGYADLIVGSPGAVPIPGTVRDGPGRVYLFTGGPAGVVEARRWDGHVDTNESFGAHLHAQDDLNGDGFDDVAVGTVSDWRLEIRHGAQDPSSMRIIFERRLSGLSAL